MLERALCSSVAGGNRNHEKNIRGPTYRRMRCSGKIYWSKNKELLPGAEVSSTAINCPTVEEVLGLLSCPSGAPGSRTTMPSPWPLASSLLLAAFWSCMYGKEWANAHVLPRPAFIKLCLYYLRLGKEQTFFQSNQSPFWSFMACAGHSP